MFAYPLEFGSDQQVALFGFSLDNDALSYLPPIARPAPLIYFPPSFSVALVRLKDQTYR
jgi:hypothetical protein